MIIRRPGNRPAVFFKFLRTSLTIFTISNLAAHSLLVLSIIFLSAGRLAFARGLGFDLIEGVLSFSRIFFLPALFFLFS
jgi:hypothetical protein